MFPCSQFNKQTNSDWPFLHQAAVNQQQHSPDLNDEKQKVSGVLWKFVCAQISFAKTFQQHGVSSLKSWNDFGWLVRSVLCSLCNILYWKREEFIFVNSFFCLNNEIRTEGPGREKKRKNKKSSSITFHFLVFTFFSFFFSPHQCHAESLTSGLVPLCFCFRYQDMRRQIGFEIRDMWYNLGNDPQLRPLAFSIYNQWMNLSISPSRGSAGITHSFDIFSLFDHLPSKSFRCHCKANRAAN